MCVNVQVLGTGGGGGGSGGSLFQTDWQVRPWQRSLSMQGHLWPSASEGTTSACHSQTQPYISQSVRVNKNTDAHSFVHRRTNPALTGVIHQDGSIALNETKLVNMWQRWQGAANRWLRPRKADVSWLQDFGQCQSAFVRQTQTFGLWWHCSYDEAHVFRLALTCVAVCILPLVRYTADRHQNTLSRCNLILVTRWIQV